MYIESWGILALLFVILYVLFGIKNRLDKQYELTMRVAERYLELNTTEPPDHPMYGGD